MDANAQVILGIDPGLANTGWGVIRACGNKMTCVAYGCVSTPAHHELSARLFKVYDQIRAVIHKYQPTSVGIETVWFGDNATSAFATGQARGAALVACAERSLSVGEFSPSQIKSAITGTGSAEKHQIQYMVKQHLNLKDIPRPDHAADALAAAICYLSNVGEANSASRLHELIEAALERDGRSYQDALTRQRARI